MQCKHEQHTQAETNVERRWDWL